MFLRVAHLRRVARFAMLAVLLHAFAPFAHAMVRAADRLPFDPLGSICRVALPGAAAGPASDASQQGSAAIDMARMCPLCVAGAHFALADVPAIAFHADTSLQHVQAGFAPLVWTLPAPELPYSSRAPPRA
ncbi:MAG: hypothetical protein QM776_04920 [Rhodocyclaceae bacterium]